MTVEHVVGSCEHCGKDYKIQHTEQNEKGEIQCPHCKKMSSNWDEDTEKFEMTFEKAFKNFIEAGWQMNELWDETKIKHYPEFMPSFDEFLSEMSKLMGEGKV